MILSYGHVPKDTRVALAEVIRSPDPANILNLIADTEFDRLPVQIRDAARKMYKTPAEERPQLTPAFAALVLDYIHKRI